MLINKTAVNALLEREKFLQLSQSEKYWHSSERTPLSLEIVKSRLLSLPRSSLDFLFVGKRHWKMSVYNTFLKQDIAVVIVVVVVVLCCCCCCHDLGMTCVV